MNAPLVTTLAMALPDTDPIAAEARTAAFAGPPLCLPVTAYARSMKNWPAPVTSRSAPNKMKMKTKDAATPNGIPYIPSWPR